MKILAISDEERMDLWDYYVPGRLKEYDLILSSGDLHASYLSFLVTMGRAPVLYVHGNHDTGYEVHPPEGCDCIEDKIVLYRGLRILGLGGCRRYRPGAHQYTEKEMEKRIRRLTRDIKLLGGVDIVVTHAPPRGVGDSEDLTHQGFQAFLDLIDSYHPAYLLHGHVHKSYGQQFVREREYAGTRVINVCQSFVLDIPQPKTPKLNWIQRFRQRNIEKFG
jgi:predicted phosphodiesterase